jgi:hypothetical protein
MTANMKIQEVTMMKKSFSILFLMVIIIGNIFAQERLGGSRNGSEHGLFSLGAGGYFTSDFGGGVDSTIWLSTKVFLDSVKTPYVGGGGFIFADARYVTLSLGIFGGSGTQKTEYSRDDSSMNNEYDLSYTGLDIGLWGKFPFEPSSKFAVFPLLGIKYRAMLSVKGESGYESSSPDDYSALWFQLGGGFDYDIYKSLYIRTEALYGLRITNKVEKDMVELYDDVEPAIGHGLEIKIAVGYRFAKAKKKSVSGD